MPVPKRKRSRARKSKRNANKGLKVQAFAHCHNCQEPIGAHQVCKGCGFYKGVKVLITKQERTSKRVEAKQAKAARAPQQPEAPAAEPAQQEE